VILVKNAIADTLFMSAKKTVFTRSHAHDFVVKKLAELTPQPVKPLHAEGGKTNGER